MASTVPCWRAWPCWAPQGSPTAGSIVANGSWTPSSLQGPLQVRRNHPCCFPVTGRLVLCIAFVLDGSELNWRAVDHFLNWRLCRWYLGGLFEAFRHHVITVSESCSTERQGRTHGKPASPHQYLHFR